MGKFELDCTLLVITVTKTNKQNTNPTRSLFLAA